MLGPTAHRGCSRSHTATFLPAVNRLQWPSQAWGPGLRPQPPTGHVLTGPGTRLTAVPSPSNVLRTPNATLGPDLSQLLLGLTGTLGARWPGWGTLHPAILLDLRQLLAIPQSAVLGAPAPAPVLLLRHRTLPKTHVFGGCHAATWHPDLGAWHTALRPACACHLLHT